MYNTKMIQELLRKHGIYNTVFMWSLVKDKPNKIFKITTNDNNVHQIVVYSDGTSNHHIML